MTTLQNAAVRDAGPRYKIRLGRGERRVRSRSPRTRRLIGERAEPALAESGLKGAVADGDPGTMHAAKGLEFRAVALVGCEDRHMPLKNARSPSPALAEDAEAHRIAEVRELSLLYVGYTGARESLLITFSGRASRYLSSPDDA